MLLRVRVVAEAVDERHCEHRLVGELHRHELVAVAVPQTLAAHLQTGRLLPDIAERTGRSLPDIAERTGRPLPDIAERTGRPLPDIDERTGRPLPDIAERTGRPLPDIAERTGRPLPVIDERTGRPLPDIAEANDSHQLVAVTCEPRDSLHYQRRQTTTERTTAFGVVRCAAQLFRQYLLDFGFDEGKVESRFFVGHVR